MSSETKEKSEGSSAAETATKSLSNKSATESPPEGIKPPLEGIKPPLEGLKHPPEGIKHPLEHTWGFWMFTADKRKWEDNLIELTTFDTVEDYWCLYHYMKTPSELKLGQDYAVFKKGIRPMWEDAANKKGGRWLIGLDRRRGDLDKLWLEIVLLLIGENIENADIVCGVVVNVRAKCKLCVWISDASNQKAFMEVGKKLKQIGTGKITFQQHDSVTNLCTL